MRPQNLILQFLKNSLATNVVKKEANKNVRPMVDCYQQIRPLNTGQYEESLSPYSCEVDVGRSTDVLKSMDALVEGDLIRTEQFKRSCIH